MQARHSLQLQAERLNKTSYDVYRLKTANYPAIGTASITANDEAFIYDAVGNSRTNTKGGLSGGVAGSTTRYYEYLTNPTNSTNRPPQSHSCQ